MLNNTRKLNAFRKEISRREQWLNNDDRQYGGCNADGVSENAIPYKPSHSALWRILIEAAWHSFRLRTESPDAATRALRFCLENVVPGIVYMTDERQRWEALARCQFFLERATAGTLTHNAIEAIFGVTVADHCFADPFAAILVVLALLEHPGTRGLLYKTEFSRNLIVQFVGPHGLVLSDGLCTEDGGFLVCESVLQAILSHENWRPKAGLVQITWDEDPFADDGEY
ncbi:MAG: hypothetical protein M0Z85_09820 [Gammaproteobacteria bacterium]|nr:hypothetical protein [Gammaproteobacteria bacterium]